MTRILELVIKNRNKFFKLDLTENFVLLIDANQPLKTMIRSQRLLFFLILTALVSSPTIHASSISLSEALEQSNSESKNIILNYDADWCLPCQFMKENVLSTEIVQKTLESDFVYVDVEIDDTASSSWMDEYSYACLPSFLVIDKSGEIIEELAGTASVSEFMNFMDRHNISRSVIVPNEHLVKTTSPKVNETPAKQDAMMNNAPVAPSQAAKFTIAVGAFSVMKNAKELKAEIEKLTGQPVKLTTDTKGLNRLTLGQFPTKGDCRPMTDILKRNKIDHYIKGL